jgi:RHS repeat-associated protein
VRNVTSRPLRVGGSLCEPAANMFGDHCLRSPERVAAGPTDSSVSNSYLRASAGLIGAIVSDSGATYTPGVSEKRGTTSTFYHADIKNSVEQTSTSQSVAASKQYDAFGNEVSSQGPWQGPFQYGGAFGYHTDSDYGLVRVSKSDSSGSNSYLRASAGLIGSIVSDSGATYTPGVSEKRGTTSTFYHADIKNSVEQTSTSQSVVASKQYDAFGNEVSSQGPWQGPFQYGGAFGYHTDSDYGLKHLGARYYDPTTGRFLSRDPIGDGRNWYVYAGSEPLARADPLGLKIVIVASPEDEKKIKEDFSELKRNPATKQMVYELINSPKVIYVTTAPSPEESRFDSFERVNPNEREILTGILYYDPDDIAMWPLAEPYLPHWEAVEPVRTLLFTPEIILAHELGHAYGYRDPKNGGPEPGETVEKVENPFRKTLGVRLRHLYFIRVGWI